MDVCRYIDSTAIREHLRALDYQFSAPEAAFLVNRCRTVTLDERMSAWEEISDTLPNCSMDRHRGLGTISDFHAFLRDYQAYKREELDRFRQAEGSAYYVERCRTRGYTGPYGVELFSSFERCAHAFLNDLDEGDDCEWFQVTRHRIDSDDQRDDRCYVDGLGRVLWVDCAPSCDDELDLAVAFSCMWFDFPTPFHAGDILCLGSMRSSPFVLTYINTWGTERMRAEHANLTFSERFIEGRDKAVERYRREGDDSDMGAYGYQVSTYGEDLDCFLWFDDFGYCDYLDLEYAPRPLTGAHRALEAVSEFIGGRCNLEFLMNAYATLVHQGLHENELVRLQRTYLAEALESVGLPGGIRYERPPRPCGEQSHD